MSVRLSNKFVEFDLCLLYLNHHNKTPELTSHMKRHLHPVVQEFDFQAESNLYLLVELLQSHSAPLRSKFD